MNTTEGKPRYSFGEEIANSVTHGIGILLSVAGLVLMVVFAARYGDTWHLANTAFFGAALTFL